MEPISAGASILAFVGLALKSAKAIHHLLSAVRDGPQIVRWLADDTAQLQGILERLSNLQSSSITQTDVQALDGLASRCANDMGDIEQRLQRLSISPVERRAGKLWKRMKTTIGEKDLDHIRNVVHGHALMLNVNLGIMQAAQTFASQAQQSEILEMLKQLRKEVAVPRATADLTAVRPIGDLATNVTIDHPETPAVDSRLDESISRLLGLVAEGERTVAFDDAQQMIDDLQTLLESAQKHESTTSVPVPLTGPDVSPESYPNNPMQNVSRELKLIQGQIFSASSMHINRNGPSRLPSSINLGILISQDRKRKSIDMLGGTMTVSTNRRIRRRLEALSGAENDDGNIHNRQDFAAKILFRPKNSQSTLVVSVSNVQLLAGNFLSIPNLSVNNFVPRDSEVFKLAAQGRTDDILALIAEGKASLRDRDELGWSLLHHACEQSQVELCKFLIRNGLDVDEVVIGQSGRITMATPLHLAYSQYNECVRILLQAGADPSFPVDGWFAIISIVGGGGQQGCNILRDIFNLVPHLADLEQKNGLGHIPFLRACRVDLDDIFESGIHIQTLSLLLDKGSSIDSRDDFGCTCLHLFFGSRVQAPSEQDWKNSLIYLISRGADIRARNNFGLSVSHFAYEASCLDIEEWSYRGDLWDAVLDACGHDIREFRKGYPRTARYTAGYRRSDFEALWKGREDRCPYWNDTDWSYSEDETRGQQNQDNGVRVICHCYNICGFYNSDGVYEWHCNEDETSDTEEDETEIAVSPLRSEHNECDDKVGGTDLAFEFSLDGGDIDNNVSLDLEESSLLLRTSMLGNASPRTVFQEPQHESPNWSLLVADEPHSEQTGEATSLEDYQMEFSGFQHRELEENPWYEACGSE